MVLMTESDNLVKITQLNHNPPVFGANGGKKGGIEAAVYSFCGIC